MSNDDTPKTPPDNSRRLFLGGAAGALGLAGLGIVVGPGLAALAYPLGNETVSGSDAFLDAGPESLFAGAEPVKVELRADTRDAWNRATNVKIGSAWVVRVEGELVALSTVCPHLGCGIDYDGESGKFLCACHNSWFSIDGEALEGPSPRGMDVLESRVENALVQIRYQRFEQGTDEKVPV